MTPIPLATLTLYSDLVQKLATAPRAGSIYTRTISGADYAYGKIALVAGRVDEYLGRCDDPDVQTRILDLKLGAGLASERRRTIAMLRRGGLPAPDAKLGTVLAAMSGAGLFDAGAVVVGTAAYLLSAPLAGALLPAPTMMTGDLDIAMATLDLGTPNEAALIDVLRLADPTFEGILQLDGREPSSRFRARDGYLVEVLTQARTRYDRNPVRLPKLQAGAIPLQHMGWLVDDPDEVVALWGSGVRVSVPRPARYAIHRLIVAQKRLIASREKRGKDLAQAAALIEALKVQDPFALEDALEDARGRGQKGWAEPIDRSLRELGNPL